MMSLSRFLSALVRQEPASAASNPPLPYTVRVNAKAKHIRISIGSDGECIVTIPKRGLRSTMLLQAERFVESKREWIRAHSERIKERARMAEERSASLAESAGLPRKKYSEKELREMTRSIVTERLRHFNKVYGYEYKDIRIKKVTSRWGSCSRKGNLNFSHKLALLSQEEIDYVVVHELCHLGEFNHSQNFWNLVARTIPDYKRISKGMKGKIL